MDQQRQPGDHAAGYGPGESSQTRRRLDPQGPEHGEDLVAHPALGPNGKGESPTGGRSLEGGRPSDGIVAESTSLSAADADGLEAVGNGSSPGGGPLARQVPDSKPRRPHPSRRRTPCIGDGSVNTQAVLELLERQQRRCALTGRGLTPESASLDHIVPVCRGGEHRIQNTQVLERSVNRAKGTLTNDEFIELCGEVWRHALARKSRLDAGSPSNN